MIRRPPRSTRTDNSFPTRRSSDLLQRIKTALTRQVLDNVYLTNNPMKEVVEGRVNLDDLLNPKIGGLVRVKEINSTREVVTPFVAGEIGRATSELQSLMRISYAVFCLKHKNIDNIKERQPR